MAELAVAIEEFKKDIENRNSNSLKELKSVKNKVSIQAAVDLAYNDAKRTMTGIGNFGHNKTTALNAIAAKLLDYFEEPAPNFDSFEEKHKELCNIWCTEFRGSERGTYGKAQKIINMAFKYLRCCCDAGKYPDHFKFCHMPLDSFTLTWYKRKTDDKKNYTWSKIHPEEYREIQKTIRNYLQKSENNLSPLELEFIVWPEIKKELAAEEFLFGLGDDLSKRKNGIKAMSLSDKYKLIIDTLSSSKAESKTEKADT